MGNWVVEVSPYRGKSARAGTAGAANPNQPQSAALARADLWSAGRPQAEIELFRVALGPGRHRQAQAGPGRSMEPSPEPGNQGLVVQFPSLVERSCSASSSVVTVALETPAFGSRYVHIHHVHHMCKPGISRFCVPSLRVSSIAAR